MATSINMAVSEGDTHAAKPDIYRGQSQTRENICESDEDSRQEARGGLLTRRGLESWTR